jgi:RNA polymerase sigma factor (sigma-70 family)
VDEGENAEIYGKHADDLVRFATGLVGPADAPDVVADAVVRAFSSRSWASVTNPRAFLTRAVLNEARMHHRSTLRRRAREARAATTDVSYDDAMPRPEVLAHIAQLSLRQRAVVVLTYWDDLDQHAIAERLGISTGSVRRHLARAHAKLRRVLDEG